MERMTARAFLSLAAAALFCALSPVWASEEEPAVTASQTPHPFFREELYPRWSEMTPEQLRVDMLEITQRMQHRMAELETLPAAAATFANTFAALSHATDEAAQLEMLVSHLHFSDHIYREHEETFFNHLSEFQEAKQNLKYSPAIQRTLTRWANSAQASGLSPKQRYLVSLMTEEFCPEPNDNTARQLAELQQELNRCLSEYEHNIRSVENSWQYIFKERSQLDGVPPGTIAAMENEARRRGFGTAEQPVWLFTPKTRTMAEVLKYCRVEATRKKCWQGLKSPGNTRSHDNGPVVLRIMKLRQDIAEIQGYKSHADRLAANTLMGSSKKALAFVDGLLRKIQPQVTALNTAILHTASQQCGAPVTGINPWDYEYYGTLATDTLNRFSLQELRPYLEYEHTLQATLKHFGNLYGLTISEIPATCIRNGEPSPEGMAEVWHPDVRIFAVHDTASGKHCGAFYLDAYARDGKKYGTSSQIISHGTRATKNNKELPPLTVLSLELHKPAPGNTQLLSHLELRMLFHELGHVFHLMLGNDEFKEQAAAFVARDFIELPAHLQEMRAWEPDVLCEIGRHYRTGEPMPRDLATKAAAARLNKTYIASLNLQLICAKMDLELHSHYYQKFHGKNLDQATRDIIAPYVVSTTVPQPSIIRNFPHCIGGYDARYYAYVLAEVMAADLHHEFKRNGVNNSAIGRNYRKTILEAGNSRPAAELYRSFMGRAVSTEAFLHMLPK